MQHLKSLKTALRHAAAFLLCVSTAHAQKAIRTESGDLAGTLAGDVRVFLGVPYARPPIGDLRWKPAEPVIRSTSTLPADRLGPSCMQKLSRSHLPWTEEFMVQNEASEDCLYLNIWAPAAYKPRATHPVLVFLHGGGFVEGSGGIASYDGASLARRGLIVVTINYRMGVFGYFANTALQEESPHRSAGNYAMSDQIAALRWVRHNIASFGGDPARVTLAGQSAGAESVAELLASPAAKGLFSRAVMNSDPLLWPAMPLTPLPEAVAAGDAWSATEGGTLTALRSIPAETLLGAPGVPGAARRPVVDGWLLSKQPGDDLRAPAGSDVPVILGWVADEGSASPAYGKVPAGQFRADADKRYGAGAADFLKLYPAGTDAEARHSEIQSARDRNSAIAGLWAEAWSRHRTSPVYLYLFSRVPPWAAHPEFAAHHTAEVPYFFGTLDKVHRDYTPEDRAVSDAAVSAWVRFSQTGTPGSGWSASSGMTGPVFDFGDTRTTRPMLDAERAAFWRSVLLAGQP